jgi:hypothetical protein
MNEVTACRAVLIEVLTILAKDIDNLVVVGGWVPELTFPHKGHIGSLDVDLALDVRKLKPLAYESIRRKLLNAGYQLAADLPNRFFRNIKGTTLQVKVDHRDCLRSRNGATPCLRSGQHPFARD